MCSYIHTLVCVYIHAIFYMNYHFIFVNFTSWKETSAVHLCRYFCLSTNSPPPALPPKKRQSAPSPTRVAVVAPMSRGSSLPCSVHRQVMDWGE